MESGSENFLRVVGTMVCKNWGLTWCRTTGGDSRNVLYSVPFHRCLLKCVKTLNLERPRGGETVTEKTRRSLVILESIRVKVLDILRWL